ncbi:hypothetical protein ACX1NB_02280 [Mycoplasma sp. HF14]
MKLKSILLTISSLSIMTAPIISCNNNHSSNNTQTSTNDNSLNNNTQLKTALDAKIQGIQNLDIKDKINYTADEIKEMNKTELAQMIEVVDQGFDKDKYGFIVVNVEKKLNEGSKYVINLEVKLFAKDKPQLLSEAKVFNNIGGFNISKDNLSELVEQAKKDAFINGLSIQVDNKEKIQISQLTKEQIHIISDADEATQKLYKVAVEDFRAKSVPTTLEVTLSIISVKSGTKFTALKELEGFMAQEASQSIEEILASNINDIKLSTKLDASNKAPFPSLVKETDIVATGYNEELLDFSVVEGSIKPKFEIIPPSQALAAFAATQFKSSISFKIKLTAKNDATKSIEKDCIIEGLSTPDKRLYLTPLKSTIEEANTPSSSEINNGDNTINKTTKSIQLIGRKNKKNYDVLVKYQLEDLNEDDKHAVYKSKLVKLRNMLIDALFEKVPDQTGKKIMLSTLTDAIRQYASRIIFTIDALYYSSNPAREYLELFDGPTVIDKTTNKEVPANYLQNANYLMYIAAQLAKNGNV